MLHKQSYIWQIWQTHTQTGIHSAWPQTKEDGDPFFFSQRFAICEQWSWKTRQNVIVIMRACWTASSVVNLLRLHFVPQHQAQTSYCCVELSGQKRFILWSANKQHTLDFYHTITVFEFLRWLLFFQMVIMLSFPCLCAIPHCDINAMPY